MAGYRPYENSTAGSYGDVQTDESGRQYQPGPKGKRHYLPGQGQEALPSVSRDFVLPILQKVQSGQPLTPQTESWVMQATLGADAEIWMGPPHRDLCMVHGSPPVDVTWT